MENIKIQIAPHYAFMSMSVRWRVIVVLALFTALSAVTSWGVISTINIIEIVSGYVSVLFLLWLAIIDIKYFILPNKILLAWFICRTILVFVGLFMSNSPEILINSAGGAGAMGLFFLVAHYLSRRSLGGGDVKLSFVLGLSLTITMIFTAVFYGLVACALFSLVGLALKKLQRKDKIPLGPFIFVGTLIAYILQIF